MQRTLENESHTYGGGRSVGRGQCQKCLPCAFHKSNSSPICGIFVLLPCAVLGRSEETFLPVAAAAAHGPSPLFVGGGGGRREINVSISRIYLIIRHGSRRRRSQRGKRRRLRLFATLLGGKKRDSKRGGREEDELSTREG